VSKATELIGKTTIVLARLVEWLDKQDGGHRIDLSEAKTVLDELKHFNAEFDQKPVQA